LLGLLDYIISNEGKTSGSRFKFKNLIDKNDFIRIHKPHPDNTLKSYQIDDVVKKLLERGLI